FQAEDGIRDDLVTGVQTCALPIWYRLGLERSDRDGDDTGALQPLELERQARCPRMRESDRGDGLDEWNTGEPNAASSPTDDESRSEERRVGKRGRERGGSGTQRRT